MATTETVTGKSSRVYLAMMLLAFFVGSTGLARVYRGDKSMGWGRFWTWVACIALGFISAALPPLFLLVGLANFGLVVWGIVDFFLLYGTKTDAAGNQLLTTTYDKKFAKVLLILFIIGLALTGVGLIVSLIFWSAIMSGIVSGAVRNQNGLNSFNSYNSYNNRTYGDSPSTSTQKFSESDAAQVEAGMSKSDVESALNGTVGKCSGSSSYEFCTYKSSSSLDATTVLVSYENGTVSDASYY